MREEIELSLSEFIGLEIKEVKADQIVFDKAILELWCPWRIFDTLIFMNADVIESKHSAAEASKIIEKSLVGRKVIDIKIYEFPSDLIIKLENDSVLEVLPTHPLFEAWRLQYGEIDGRDIIAVPGGEVTWFLKPGES